MKNILFLIFLISCSNHNYPIFNQSDSNPSNTVSSNELLAKAIGWTESLSGFELALNLKGSSKVNGKGYLYIDSLCNYPSGDYKVTTESSGSFNDYSDTFYDLRLKATKGSQKIYFHLESAGLVSQSPAIEGRDGKEYTSGMWAFLNFECGRYLVGYGSASSQMNLQRGLASLHSYKWLSLILIFFMVFFTGLSWFVWSYKSEKQK